jgi:O-antigen/teichoic acid export membrane protein
MVPLLYGPEYAAAVPLLRLGIWVAVALFVNAFLATLLQAVGESGVAARLLWPAVLANTVLGAVLVSRFGALGAVWTTLAAQWLLVVLHLLAVRRWFGLASILEGVGGLVAGTAGMVLVVGALGGAPLVLSLAAGAATFGLLCLRLYPLTVRDVAWLRSTLAQRRPG